MSLFLEMLPLFMKGLGISLLLLIQSAFWGLLLTVPLVLMRLSSRSILRGISYVYIIFFRGTPLLVQFFIFYYGLAQFEWVRGSVFWILLKPALGAAILTLAMNTAAYTAEIFVGAMRLIPKGDIDAARALGMSRGLVIRRIMAPKAFALALPAYGNEIIYLLKGTAIVFSITVLDLMGVANLMRATSFLTYEPLLLAAIFYLAITYLLTQILSFLEKRFRIE